MAHVACVDHGRRVVFTTKSIIHRNGDGSPCDSKLFKIGEVERSRFDLKLFNIVEVERKRSRFDLKKER